MRSVKPPIIKQVMKLALELLYDESIRLQDEIFKGDENEVHLDRLNKVNEAIVELVKLLN